MSTQVALPNELAQRLGDNTDREVPQATLLELVLTRRVNFGRAAELLGMSRYEAIRWYNAHGLPYPNLTTEELEHELAFVKRFSSA